MKFDLDSNEIYSIYSHAIQDAHLGWLTKEQCVVHIGFSYGELASLMEKIDNFSEALAFSKTEKQIILNCIAGSVDYVNSDISSLYDYKGKSISESDLKGLLEQLEIFWE